MRNPAELTDDELLGMLQQRASVRGMSDEQLLSAIGARSQQDDWAERTKVDRGGFLSDLAIGMGRGFTDVGQGIQQWFRSDDYDRRVQDEAALYERGMGDSYAAMGGRGLGQLLATAVPAGAATRAVSMLPRVAAAAQAGFRGQIGAGAATGAAGGAVEGALLADTTGQGKASQIASSALLGGATGGILGGGMKAFDDLRDLPRGLLRGDTPNNPNTLARGRAAAGETLESAIRGSGSAGRKADALQEATGIHLTPADRTGGRFMRFLENMASQSLVSADQVAVGRAKTGRQMVNFARRIAHGISANGDNVKAAQDLQAAVRGMTEDMARRRTEQAGALYREIDQVAGSAPVVQLTNTERALDELIEEFSVAVGHDANKIAEQAKRFRSLLAGTKPRPEAPQILNPQTGRPWEQLADQPIGKLSASQAMLQLQAWSKAARGSGRLFDDVSPSADQHAARRLYEALMSDLDEAAAQGGTVGQMLRAANDSWRQHSQQIEALENSILGDVVGREFADEINGIAHNSVAPQTVLDRFRRADPKEIMVARSYLERYNPEAWQQLKRAYLDEAVAVARSSTATQQTNVIEPAELIRQLTGGSTRKMTYRGRQRLQALFGGSDEWADIQRLLDVAGRKADSFGYNSSGTSPQEGARKLLGALNGGLMTGLGTFGEIAGLRKIARHMMPGQAPTPTGQQFLPYRRLPGQLGPVPTTGLAGVLAAQQYNNSQSP